MTRRGWVVVCLTLTASGFTGQHASAATLRADYEFQGTRTSTVPGAPDLTDVGPGGDNAFIFDNVFGQSQQVLAFPMGNGLTLTPVTSIIDRGVYSLVITARLDQITGYSRLVDFANGTLDNGLYVQGGTLVLYPDANGTSDRPIGASQYVQITLTRDAAGIVVGYINRSQVLGPYDDSLTGDALVTADDVLRFFIDDAATTGEDSAGAVARIRVYDAPLTADEVAALAPAETPVLGKSEVARVVRGTVRIAVPGGGFVTLTDEATIPVGSTVDTTDGTVRLTSAADSAGHVQTGDFSGGVFRIAQSKRRAARGLTTLRLTGALAGSCAAASSTVAHAAAGSQTQRKLKGRAKGRFRTRGKYSAATVRGTIWTVADRCDGTLTSVRRGVVSVRDYRRHRTVRVRAGHRYLARP